MLEILQKISYKILDYDIRGELSASDEIDKNGFFVGNDFRDLKNEIHYLHELFKEFEKSVLLDRNKNEKALITGITGQDGAYLAKLLIEKGYKVYGTVRRSTSEKFVNLKYLNIYDKIKFYDFDLLELSNIQNVIKETKPHEIYHLAAQSFVPTSFKYQ